MCVCVPFYILTFVCPYLVILPYTCQPANQPTNRQSWSTTNGSFVCTHLGIIVCLLQMEKLMYDELESESESAILSHVYVFIYPHTLTHARWHAHINNPFTCEYVFHLMSYSRSLAHTTITAVALYNVHCTLYAEQCVLYTHHGYAMFLNGKSIFSVGDDDAVVGRLGNCFLRITAHSHTLYRLSMVFCMACVLLW